MRGCFVTATDTGVGKTVVAAAICCRLRALGHVVVASKPVVTGIASPEPGVPADHELLAACTGQQAGEVTRHAFGPAVSPHLAAELAGVALTPGDFAPPAPGAAVMVAEGVGGLLVPLTVGYSVRDHAVELALPLVIAARPGLGTINHTLLTIEGARSAGLDVRSVVITPWPAAPSQMQESNAATIAELGAVEVAFLGVAAGLTPAQIGAVAHTLPVERWV